MKSKQNLLVVALHVVVLAGFSLLQGCATGECPIDWLNWPYNAPADEPILVPTDEFSDSLVLPPDTYNADGMISTYTSTGPSQTYTVQKGDTLSAIASMYDTSWKKLAEFNSLSNPNKLYVGQEIQIPGLLSTPAPIIRSSAPSGSSVVESSSPIKQGTSYVIQKGDTLSGIAKRSGLSVSEVKAANALNSNVIIAGKSLSIPKKGEVSVPVYSVPVVDVALEPAPLADIAPLAPSTSAPVYEHVLYPGETLEDVARQYGSSQEEIMMLNGITSPDAVKPGTKLLVPIPE